jgi:hypothetical protein
LAMRQSLTITAGGTDFVPLTSGSSGSQCV